MGRILLIAWFTTCLGYAGETQLSVRTLAVEEGAAIPVWHIVSDSDTYKELKWPVQQPSSVILSTASNELLLFSKKTNAEGTDEFKVARKLTIPEGSHDVLLVAWPDDGDQKVGLMVVADDLKQAKSNDWLVINTSKQGVTLRYGTKSEAIQLEPSEAKPYRIDSEQGKGGAVLAQTMVKDERKTIYSTFWAAPENQRSLVLFYNKDNRVKLRRVIDLFPTGK